LAATQKVTTRERWVRVLVFAALGVCAAVHSFLDLGQAFGPDDTQYQETTLDLVAAGQFLKGPGALYGPFQGGNHRVLVHAPLYYRLTGLVAWPLVSRGMNPLQGCFVAGRIISFASFLGCLLALDGLATLDGATRRGGAFAVLLALGSWVIDGYAVTVRPDLLAAMFQLVGALAVLRTLHSDQARSRGWRLGLAALAFALGLCAKQHAMASLFVCMGMLVHRAGHKPEWKWPLARACLLGLAVLVGYYTCEDVLTSGHMKQSVFLLASDFRRLEPGDWANVVVIFNGILYRSFALVIFALACLLTRTTETAGGELDKELRLLLGGEAILTAFLCWGSLGAWINYGILGVLFACVLIGRSIARRCGPESAPRRVWVLGIAGSLVLGVDLWSGQRFVRNFVNEELTIDYIMRDPRIRSRSPSEIYFLGLPQYNRQLGRLDLAHDEWLYGLYERVGAAEHRGRWLRPALLDAVRIVIVPSDPPIPIPLDPPVPPGLAEPLSRLGYDRILTFGRYQVWERRGAPRLSDRPF
jgi:hypothetical protein